MARDQTFTTAEQIDDDTVLKYLNLVYRDVVNNIIEANQWYYWQRSTADLIAGRNEYALPEDVDKVKNVYIKYQTSDYYTECIFRSFSEIERSIENLNDTLSKSNPIAIIADDSVFIAPAPEQDFTDGLRLNYIEFPEELTLSSTENEIDIPKQYHDVLWLGIKQYIFSSRGMFEEKNNAFQEYANMINKLKAYVRPRVQNAKKALDANLNHLK